MFKSHLFTFVLLFIINCSFGQALSLSWDNEPIGDDLVLTGSPADSEIVTHLIVTNNTSSSMDIKLRRTHIEMIDDVLDYFCWADNCYPPTTDVSTYFLSLPGGESSSEIDFSGHYMPKSHFGDSYIEYEFFNMNNTSENVKVLVQYSATLTGIVEQKIDFLVLPNPATDFVSFRATENMKSIAIYNAFGSQVMKQNINSSEYQMSTSHLESGVYFVKIISETKTITKSIVIN